MGFSGYPVCGDPRRHWVLLCSPIVILLVAAALRFAMWAVGLASPDSFSGGDTPDYWLLAGEPMGSYRAREGIAYELGLRRPPGYPALLAIPRAIGFGMAGAALLQIFYAVAAVAVTMALARRLVGVREAAVAGWWLALDPLHVVESSILLTEIPFSLAMLLAAYAVWKALQPTSNPLAWWVVAGAMLAVATLIRPITFYLPPLVLLVVLVAGPRIVGWSPALSGALLLLISFAIPVGGWMARNQMMSGVATISTIQGASLAMYRAPAALMEGRGLRIDVGRARVAAMVDARLPPGANPAERAKVQERVGLEVIRSEPVGYAISAAKGLGRMLVGPGGAHIRARTAGVADGDGLGFLLTGISALSAIAGSLLMMAAFWLWARRRQWLTFALIGIPIFYLALVSSGPEAYSRFRLQMLSFMLIAAASAGSAAIDWSRTRRGRYARAAPASPGVGTAESTVVDEPPPPA